MDRDKLEAISDLQICLSDYLFSQTNKKQVDLWMNHLLQG